MPPLVAIKPLVYAGQRYVQGEAFEARTVSDATILKVTRLAVDSPEPLPDHEDDITAYFDDPVRSDH